MKMMNIIYTNTMAEAVAFYKAIGLQPMRPGTIDEWWNVLTLGDAEVALHWNAGDPLPEPSSRLELHFALPDRDLDDTYADFQRKGLIPGSPIEMLEGVGRYFWLTDPDGMKVQFNGIPETGQEQ